MQLSGVLGTVDALLVDQAIMEEVKEPRRNLTVAYYDYQKAYDHVHHDWILRVVGWMGFPENVRNVMKILMEKWKTRIEITKNGKKVVSREIDFKCGFLQGDSLSPVGFCLTEVHIAMLLSDTAGYRMGSTMERNLKKMHSLFIDDLKVYQESHARMEIVNETIVEASNDIGSRYGVKKCAEAVFRNGVMVEGSGLKVLEERMKTLNPEKNEYYKFLGCEQAAGIDRMTVVDRIKKAMKDRIDKLWKYQLYDKNLMKAINTMVIPIATYPMNVMKISRGDLVEMESIIKRELRSRNMHGRLGSDERMYLPRELGGRGMRSIVDAYEQTKIRISCYLAMSQNDVLQEVWKRECEKEFISVKREAADAMRSIGIELKFEDNRVHMDGKLIDGSWKQVWKILKNKYKKGRQNKRVEEYKLKEMQSEYWCNMDPESHLWLQKDISSVHNSVPLLGQGP